MWRINKKKEKNDESCSLIPGNADAERGAAVVQLEHGGLLNRAVRRIRQGSQGSSILPMHQNSSDKLSTKKFSQKPRQHRPGRNRPGTSPCNSFLLGGTYYPGKDKRRRVNHPYKRHSLCYRIFFSSIIRTLFTIVLSIYIFSYINASLGPILMRQTKMRKKSNSQLPEESKFITEKLENIEMVKETVEFEEKNKEGPSSSFLSKIKLDTIQRIIPEWAHRNALNDDAMDETKKKRNAKTHHHGSNQRKKSHEKLTPDSNIESIKYSFVQKMHPNALESPIRMLENSETSDSCPPYPDNEQINVTLVIQSTPDRLWLIEETCRRWNDPIVLVVYDSIDQSEISQPSWYEAVASLESSCPQLHIISVQPLPTSTPSTYPVNRLRNIGLDAIRTSHFLVIDIDFVPSSSLRDIIHKQLNYASSTSNGDMEALVVPAFERINHEGNISPCESKVECREFMKNNPLYLPSSFEELQDCLQKDNKCSVFQSNDNMEGHFTTNAKRWLNRVWYEDEEGNAIQTDSSKSLELSSSFSPITISCFHSYRYEPYVILRWCPNHTPYYDERFYGYGKNKIQYVSHLRFLGYKFKILPKGFIVHFPHRDSKVKESWNNIDENDLHLKMDQLYPVFLSELKTKHGHPKIPTCKR